jgi:hypothetical protein
MNADAKASSNKTANKRREPSDLLIENAFHFLRYENDLPEAPRNDRDPSLRSG